MARSAAKRQLAEVLAMVPVRCLAFRQRLGEAFPGAVVEFWRSSAPLPPSELRAETWLAATAIDPNSLQSQRLGRDMVVVQTQSDMQDLRSRCANPAQRYAREVVQGRLVAACLLSRDNVIELDLQVLVGKREEFIVTIRDGRRGGSASEAQRARPRESANALASPPTEDAKGVELKFRGGELGDLPAMRRSDSPQEEFPDM
ncbi:hypothetical protein ACTMU2_13010 [Cupriavidus basilensis]